MASQSEHLSTAFSLVRVGGVQCVVLKFGTLPDDKRKADKAKYAQRNVNDSIGSKYKDNLMLDC